MRSVAGRVHGSELGIKTDFLSHENIPAAGFVSVLLGTAHYISHNDYSISCRVLSRILDFVPVWKNYSCSASPVISFLMKLGNVGISFIGIAAFTSRPHLRSISSLHLSLSTPGYPVFPSP